MVLRFLIMLILLTGVAFVIGGGLGAGDQAGSILINPQAELSPVASGKLRTMLPKVWFDNQPATVVLAALREQGNLNLVIDQRAVEPAGHQ